MVCSVSAPKLLVRGEKGEAGRSPGQGLHSWGDQRSDWGSQESRSPQRRRARRLSAQPAPHRRRRGDGHTVRNQPATSLRTKPTAEEAPGGLAAHSESNREAGLTAESAGRTPLAEYVPGKVEGVLTVPG